MSEPPVPEPDVLLKLDQVTTYYGQMRILEGISLHVGAGELPRYLPPMISTRVAAGLRSRGTGTTAYLPWPGS